MRKLINPLFHDLVTFVLDTIFPKYCFGCKEEGEYLCRPCMSMIKLDQSGNQFPVQKITPLDYHDPLLSFAIISGKYKFLPDVFRVLTKYTTDRLISALPQSEIILCPIPLSKRRLRWRGFNQAHIICDTISGQTGWSIIPLLARIRNTASQKDLDRNNRQKNIAGCFQIITAPPSHATIVLVDDVITTGATMLEAVKIIRQNYFNNVVCFAIAAD